MLIWGVCDHLGGLDVDMGGWKASGRFGSCYAGLESIWEVRMLICRIEEHLGGLYVDMGGLRASGRFGC